MIALLAAQGLTSIRVGGEVRACIISTGDELVQPGAPLQPGQIYDSNSVLLEALLRKCGAKVVSVTRCADRADETEAAVRGGVDCDVMILTGGVSVGAHDFVKAALAAAGATLDLWRVAVKPGKPFLFGHAGECAIFGLPGNPVSAFVTFLLFVRPALLRMMGAGDAALGLPEVAVRLSEEIRNDGPRPHYLRGRGARWHLHSQRAAGVARTFRPQPVERASARESGRNDPRRGDCYRIHFGLMRRAADV